MDATKDTPIESDAGTTEPSTIATGSQPTRDGGKTAEQRNGGGKDAVMDAGAEAPRQQTAAERGGNGQGRQDGVGAAAAQAATPPPGSDSAEHLAPDGGKPLDKISAVGHAAWLMSQSPLHKHLFITDLDWLLMPPIAAGQFRLWRKENMPLAFASWAFLTEEAEQRLIAGRGKLAPGAWSGGDRLWLMDLIAPFGGREEAVKELKTVVFPGRTIKSLNPGQDGKLQVVEF